MGYVYHRELTVVKGDKEKIGYKRSNLNFDFSNRKITIKEGMNFYISTDGFSDQLDADNRRFGSRRFRELLKQAASLPFEKQRELMFS